MYGDPVAGSGWIDGMIHPAGDRRAGLATGRFTIQPGDTQEVVVASIVAIGSNNLQSITELKSYDLVAQNKYDNFFDINTGVEEDHFSNPIDFELFQNYPNPFNPSTKIRWQVPVGSWQTLKIYDVLGNEVATLVDEYKPAGTYELEWDASDLPSGIYFYQLKAGSFVETKKMILLK